jgi:hypothetical protein
MRTSLGIVLAVTVASGCSQVDYLDLEPDVVVLKQRNNMVWMRARPMSQTGVHYAQEKVTWSVKDPSIAQIDESGKLTPVRTGRTEVIARHREVMAAVPVEVIFAEKMQVEPSTVTLQEGDEPIELTVKVWDGGGRELRDRTPTYQTLNKKVVSIGQNALFPLGPGTAEVEVRVDELVQRVPVTVTPEKKKKR